MAFDGRHVIAEGFAAAQAGGGWIDYEVLNPTNGVVDAKTSFILPLGADILIGCDLSGRGDKDADYVAEKLGL